MARRRVADPVTIHSWEEADALLGQIAERQREVTRIELEMNQRIAVLKENAKAAVKVHQTEIAAGEKQLALFAAQHREDFGKGKSKPLTHGVIGWAAVHHSEAAAQRSGHGGGAAEKRTRRMCPRAAPQGGQAGGTPAVRGR